MTHTQMLRSFIAIQIPPEVQGAIANSTSSLRLGLPKMLVRWVTTQNLHLTIKFLGDVSSAHLDTLADHLRNEVSCLPGFEMKLTGMGAFPDTRKIRILWVGLEAPAELTTIQQSVEKISLRMGYSSENCPFSPHLTIGRVNQEAPSGDILKIRDALEAMHIGSLGKIRVDAIHIYKSVLQPGGAVYTSLYCLPLMNSST